MANPRAKRAPGGWTGKGRTVSRSQHQLEQFPVVEAGGAVAAAEHEAHGAGPSLVVRARKRAGAGWSSAPVWSSIAARV